MTETRVDPVDSREARMAARVRAWSDQAVEPIDALTIAREAASTARSRAGLVGRLRTVGTAKPDAPMFGHRHRRRPVLAPIALAVSLVALGFATMALLFAVDRPPTRPVGPSPTASDDLFGRLVIEELAPGIHHVVGDGTEHDLALDDIGHRIQAGGDGSVWLFDWPDAAAPRRFFRLGEPGTYDAGPVVESPDIAVDRDGTLWTIGSGGSPGVGPQVGTRLLAWAGGGWTTHDPPPGHLLNGVEVAADGAVLVTGFLHEAGGCPGRPVVWWVAPDGWHELPALPDEVRSAGGGAWIADGQDGTLWLAVDTFASRTCVEHGGLFRFDGSAWAMVPEVPSGSAVQTGWPASGRTGAMWLFATPDQSQADRVLARFAAGSWARYGAPERVPAVVGTRDSRTAMGVGLDDTLYMAFSDQTDTAFDYNRALGVFTAPDDHGPCPGVRAFDGRTWRHHLDGRCANDLSVAPDGRIWVVAKPDPFAAVRYVPLAPADPGLYVIDPSRLAVPGAATTTGRQRP